MKQATVISVRAKGKDGKRTVIKLGFDGGDCREYTISEGTYRNIGCPLSGEEISAEYLCDVEREDGEYRALSAALKILSFADNSERTLYRKLVERGCTRECARFATEECVRLGYIDERRQISRAVLLLHEQLVGPKKMLSRLVARGYNAGKIRLEISRLQDSGEINFSSSRTALIEKKLGSKATAEEKSKLLHRYGY